MTWTSAPLWSMASCNDEVLTESTDPDYEFDYIDIGAVSREAGVTAVERHRFEGAPSRARRVVRTGDVIVSTVRTYLQAVARIGPKHAGHIVSTGFAVLRPRGDVDSRFLGYVVTDDTFVDRVVAVSVGVSYPAVTAGTLLRLHVPEPPAAKQRQIADFLDRECERIAAALASGEAVAASATSGLSEERERVYIDDVRPTRLTGVLMQPPRYGVLVPSLQDVGVPFIRVGNLDRLRGGLATVTARIPPSQALEYRRTTVQAGDVLVSVVGSIDKSAIVPDDLDGANVARAVAVLRPGRMTSVLLWGWTRTDAYREQARLATSADTAQPTLNMRDLAHFRIGVPADPEAAQRRLEKIEALLLRIDRAARGVQSALREYRGSLIHEAVTGRLDVSRVSETEMDERLHAATESRLGEMVA